VDLMAERAVQLGGLAEGTLRAAAKRSSLGVYPLCIISQREHINALLASGLSPRALIALSQLVAYVNFQARVRAGLRLLGGTHEQADA